MFHVHYTPLWTAIGEPDSRFRKPAGLRRMIERVMLLDAVLDDGVEYTWLGPATDRRRHFVRHLADRLPLAEYPRSVVGNTAPKAVRYFPDKLPIGVQPSAQPHVLIYLVTRPSPMDFRLFLLRQVGLLRALYRWTTRLLIPRPLRQTANAFPAPRSQALYGNGWTTLTTRSGWPGRRAPPTRWPGTTGTGSASICRGSTCISPHWLMSGDLFHVVVPLNANTCAGSAICGGRRHDDWGRPGGRPRE
jgi:hypothetical protein